MDRIDLYQLGCRECEESNGRAAIVKQQAIPFDDSSLDDDWLKVGLVVTFFQCRFCGALSVSHRRQVVKEFGVYVRD